MSFIPYKILTGHHGAEMSCTEIRIQSWNALRLVRLMTVKLTAWGFLVT